MHRAGLCLSVLTALVVFGCGEDGETPDCPPLPLYDVRVLARREALRAELTDAADKGCITLPTGFEFAGSGGAGTGGTGNGGGASGMNAGGATDGGMNAGGATDGGATDGGMNAGGATDGSAGEGGSGL
jgi:hypothetical protein